jgi:hypothetical protein
VIAQEGAIVEPSTAVLAGPDYIPGFAIGAAFNVLFRSNAIGGGKQGPESVQVGNDYAIAQPMYGPEGTYARVSWTKDYFSSQLNKEIVGKAERALREAEAKLARQEKFLKEMQDRPDGIDATHEANMQANIEGARAGLPALQREYDAVKDLPTESKTQSVDVRMADVFEVA